MLTDVNRLCCNVNAICVERDQVIEKLNELKITQGDFKWLTSYYVEEENIVRDNVMPPKEKNSRNCTKLCKGNTKDLCKSLAYNQFWSAVGQ